MLLIFTKVSEGRPLYKRDLLNACCAAEGTTVHFSYSEGFVHPDCHPKAHQLEGAAAWLVFCEEHDRKQAFEHAQQADALVLRQQDDAGKTAATQNAIKAWDSWAESAFKFFPIRTATVTKATAEYESVNFALTLGPFADYSKTQTLTAPIESLRTQLLQQRSHPARHREHAKYVVELANVPPIPTTRAWLPLARFFVKLNRMKTAVFWAFESAESARSGEAVAPFASAMEQGSIVLQGGKRYPMVMHLVYGPDARHLPPTVVLDKRVGEVVGPIRRQRNSGEQVIYELVTNRPLAELHSWMMVRCPTSADSPHEVLSPEWAISARVAPNVLRLGVLVVLFGLGTVAPSVTFQQLGWDTAPDWTHWIPKAIGAGMLMLGALLGFKRLPSS